MNNKAQSKLEQTLKGAVAQWGESVRILPPERGDLGHCALSRVRGGLVSTLWKGQCWLTGSRTQKVGRCERQKKAELTAKWTVALKNHRKVIVLVCQGWEKVPHTDGLTPQKSIVSQSWMLKSEIEILVGVAPLGSSEVGSVLSYQIRTHHNDLILI